MCLNRASRTLRCQRCNFQMRTLSAAELLRVWECGLDHGPVARALDLLGAACPETSPDVLADLSIGQRDAMLLTLRELTFGPEMNCLITCARCGERLELSVTVNDLRAEGGVKSEQDLSVSMSGYDLRLRLPNSRDLADASLAGATKGPRALLERCLLSVSVESKPAVLDHLPAEVINAAADRLAEADPQADIQLAVSCPGCQHNWQAIFDIGRFFWSEIEAWAARLLREVHCLASAYGWHERDIIGLSSLRRQFYLEMLGR